MLTEEQVLIVETARSFARDRLVPGAAEWDRTGKLPSEVLRELGELGFLGMTIDPEWGGAGTDYVSYALALMEIAAGDGSVSTIMSVQNAPVCAVLASHGSAAQKERWLRPLASGRMIGAFALTEPQAGSDAAAIRTRATRRGQHYVLHGTKQFISSASIAGVAIVFASTDPTAGKRGISAFLVPTDSAGFVVTRIEEKLGQKAADTCALAFEDLELPRENLLGEEGDGLKIALASLEQGRIGIAAQSVGMAMAALNYAIDYAHEREQFGRPIIDHQAVAFRLAELATRLEAARQLVLHAARLRDAAQPCLKEACMAKLFASEAAHRATDTALQLFGGSGYVRDAGLERHVRDARILRIYEGTSEVQRMIIARETMRQ